MHEASLTEILTTVYSTRGGTFTRAGTSTLANLFRRNVPLADMFPRNIGAAERIRYDTGLKILIFVPDLDAPEKLTKLRLHQVARYLERKRRIIRVHSITKSTACTYTEPKITPARINEYPMQENSLRIKQCTGSEEVGHDFRGMRI